MTQSDPSTAVTAEAPELPFDKAAIAVMRTAANIVMASHPEVRSVIAVFDYAGGLNDANVEKALWIGDGGAVKSLAAVFGSVHNTMQLLEFMFSRWVELENNMRDSAQVLGDTILKRRQELAELEQLIASRRSPAAPPASGADAGDGTGLSG